MPSPSPCSGPDQELVDLAGRDNLVDEWVDRGATAVDDALSADLDHGGIGQDSELRRRIDRSDELWIGKRTLHEERLELRRRICHWGQSFRFSRARAPRSATERNF